MPEATNTDLKFQVGTYVESLKDTLFAAAINWDIYWVYKQRDSRATHREVLDRYGQFFALSLHAHFVASIIAIYRALESSSTTINLRMLLNAIQEAQMLSEQELQPFQQRLSGFLPVWQGVAIIRSNVFAHESRHRDSDYYFQRAGVNYDHIAGLISDMQSFLSSLTGALYNNPISFETFVHDELVQLLTDLKHVPKARQQQRSTVRNFRELTER